jgi:hypothetical protein
MAICVLPYFIGSGKIKRLKNVVLSKSKDEFETCNSVCLGQLDPKF